MARNKKSGHDRKRWRITFKLPIVHHQHTQRPMTLSTDEFSFTSYGYAAGVAVQRAWHQLRAVPELKGAIIRDCFITVKCLGYFTKADEGLKPLTQIEAELEKEEIGSITCPYCKADITQYPRESLAFTKHMVGECCIGMEYQEEEEEFPMSPYRTGPLQQTCPKCGKVFDFPEMCSVTQCPHCGELQEPQ